MAISNQYLSRVVGEGGIVTQYYSKFPEHAAGSLEYPYSISWMQYFVAIRHKSKLHHLLFILL